jgi:RNA polymerase sigma factor (sigma-70 family)
MAPASVDPCGRRGRIAGGLRAGIVLGQIERLFGRGTVSGLSEGQLLARFVGERDEAAFEALVSRHGPMVLGLCRRLLHDPHDVEDAFQATFLVLVRRAGSLRDRELLANWLYGVALRVATRCRRQRERRRNRSIHEIEERLSESPSESDEGELRSVIDLEVARLPARFRSPILLCYFEGLTHDQAAERLGCPVGTVRSRMAKGRELLRGRLSRRGFEVVSAIPPAPVVGISPAVPRALVLRTSEAAGAAAGRSLLAGGASLSAVTLARGVLRAMTCTKWMIIAVAFVALGAAGGGMRVAARQDSVEPAKVEVRGRFQQDAGLPARKSLEEIQSAIHDHELQLRARHNEIEGLNEQVAAIKERIRKLEAQAKAANGNAASSPRPEPAGASPSPGPVDATSGQNASAPGHITMSPEAIVWTAPSEDRVVIFVQKSGRSRTYHPPVGTDRIHAGTGGNHVILIANGPTTHQLAAYDLVGDRWAIQDLHRNKDSERYSIWFQRSSAAMLPLYFTSGGFTQLAVFDFRRFCWSIRDLNEPVQYGGQTTPWLDRDVALYVLGRHLYAYSTVAGRWDTLTLEEPLIPASLEGTGMAQPYLPAVSHNSIAISRDGRLHVFTAESGRWLTIDSKDGK